MSDEKQQGNLEQVDPAKLLWLDLVHRIFETPDSFQGLSESEKRYFAVNVFIGEVYNGGFYQFFSITLTVIINTSSSD